MGFMQPSEDGKVLTPSSSARSEVFMPVWQLLYTQVVGQREVVEVAQVGKLKRNCASRLAAATGLAIPAAVAAAEYHNTQGSYC